MSKFRCPQCFRPNYVPQDIEETEIECSFCSKTINVPKPSYPNGTDLDGFVIQEWLGNGSLGEIYLAKQTSIDDRLTAIKIVTKDHIRCEEDMERFFREIKLVAQLNHKHIATAFTAAKFDDGVYLVSEYVEGKTLDDILAEGELSEEDIVEYSQGIASALQYAWEKHRILHRDLKPTNFMVNDKNNIFLVDMCVAKSLEILSDITLQGQVVGTPYYISPEQAQGETDLDAATDMYGMGATLYQMMTGKPPFYNEGTQLEIAAKKLSELPQWSEESLEKYSEALRDFVMQLLAIEKTDRFASWSAVLDEISKLGSSQDDEDSNEETSVEEVKQEESSESSDSEKENEEVKQEESSESSDSEKENEEVKQEESSDEKAGGPPTGIIVVAVVVAIIIIIAVTSGGK